MNPLAIARPSPEPVQAPVGRSASTVEGLEDTLALGRIDAGSLIDDADHDPVAGPARVYRDRTLAGVAAGVLEQVGQRALELGGIGAKLGHPVVNNEPDAGPGPRSPSLAAATRSSTETQSVRGAAPPAWSRERSSSLSTRSGEPSGLLDDDRAQLGALGLAERASCPARGRRRPPRSGACADRGTPPGAGRS